LIAYINHDHCRECSHWSCVFSNILQIRIIAHSSHIVDAVVVWLLRTSPVVLLNSVAIRQVSPKSEMTMMPRSLLTQYNGGMLTPVIFAGVMSFRHTWMCSVDQRATGWPLLVVYCIETSPYCIRSIATTQTASVAFTSAYAPGQGGD